MPAFFSPATNKGFTLVEIVVVLGITALLMGAITEVFLVSSRSRSIIFNQLSAQGDARRAVDGFVNQVRQATYSAVGAYPIELADAQQFIFFTNADVDGARERVRYFLSGTTLKKGVIDPVGNPSTYPAANEVVVDVATSITNGAQPLFYYYDQNYTGTATTSLAVPADVSKVRIVGLKLIIDKDPASSPVPFIIESKAAIRNLKSN